MVTIGLYTPDQAGSLSDVIFQRLMKEKSILRFIRYETEEDSLKALSESLVDAVWILPENLETELEKMARKGSVKPVARVVEREDDIALVFTREVLCSRIFPELTYQVYLEFVREKLDGDLPQKEELMERYDRMQWKGNLFQPEFLDGTKEAGESYFMSPIRGLLAIWLVISGFAAVMYHKQDETRGLYDAIPGRKRILYSLGLQAVVLFNGSIIYLLACRVMGIAEQLWHELGYLLLFLVMIAVFCNFIGSLFKKMESIGIMVPILTILMIAFCPIFINIRKYWMLQCVMPPYLYLKVFHGVGYLKYMFLYVVIGGCACTALNQWKYRQ